MIGRNLNMIGNYQTPAAICSTIYIIYNIYNIYIYIYIYIQKYVYTHQGKQNLAQNQHYYRHQNYANGTDVLVFS